MRFSLLLILAWTILGVPALCMAGTLLHDCECGTTIGCAHEEECSDDPCKEVLALPSSGFDDVDEASPEVIPFDPAPSTRTWVPLRSLELPAQQNLPFPPSQRPLLI